VAASRWHPILALLAGLACGLITGAAAGAIVAAWPIIRAIWWWAPETVIGGSLIFGWIELADHTTLIIRLAVTTAIIGIPAAIKPVRTRIHQVTWCLVTRHRIQTCFSEFIITNRTGSLPLILWARPTPVGERVWIWLRPGLALADLQKRLDQIAVACWATAALAEVASRSNAALVRMDIKRRDVLGGTITSPLLELIKSGAPPPPAGPRRDPGRAGPAPGPRQRGRHRDHPTAGTAQAARSPQDARPGITPRPTRWDPQRHRRLDRFLVHAPGLFPSPGRPLPQGRPAGYSSTRGNPTAHQPGVPRLPEGEPP